MKARMAAYGGYQFRDYLVGRGALTILATCLAAWGYAAFTGVTSAAFDPSTGIEGRDQVQRAFTAVLAAPPSHGAVVLDPDGSFIYTPAADFNGTDTFTYRAADARARTFEGFCNRRPERRASCRDRSDAAAISSAADHCPIGND